MTTQASTFSGSVALPREQTASQSRILAIDALRGTALILMALTHAAFFIGVGMQAESYGGQPVYLQSLPYWFTGLLTTLASPIFFFLAGVSLALYEAGQRRKQASEWAITRFMLARAGAVLALDVTVCNWLWMGTMPYVHVLTTMALGMALLCVLRYLPTWLTAAIALATLLIYQGALMALAPELAADAPQSLGKALLLTYSYDTQPAVGFPLLGWGPVIWLGFVLGREIGRPALRRPRTWAAAGTGLLLLWLALRLIGGYGDIGPFNSDLGLAHFLVMSKAPPSLSYLAFKLGIAALLLAGLYARPQLLEGPLRVLVTVGQTSLFFYVAHIVVYHVLAQAFLALDPPHLPGIVYGYAVWLVGLAVLLWLAPRYRALRKSHPNTPLRYL